jgi:hypothetical protein
MVESKEERDKKRYSKASMTQLLGLKKRLKAIKQMPALVANRNESLLAQSRYNKEVDYARLRNNIASHIPPYQGSSENKRTVLGSLF